MRLFLARHGNTFAPGEICTYVGRQTDLPLVQTGWEQAKALGACFKNEPITAIYTGSLKRHKETAQIVTQVMGYEGPVKHDVEALTEIDYGKWEGKSAEQIKEQWPDEYLAWTTSCTWPRDLFEGSFEGHLEAIQAWLEELRSTYSPGDTLLAIGSGGIIRYFYAFQTVEWERLAEEGRIGELKVGPGRFCELEVKERGVEVVQWNVSPS